MGGTPTNAIALPLPNQTERAGRAGAVEHTRTWVWTFRDTGAVRAAAAPRLLALILPGRNIPALLRARGRL